MKDRPTRDVEMYRERNGDYGSDESYGNNGVFYIPMGLQEQVYRVNAKPSGVYLVLRVLISDGYGWDHVSVSLAHRCPTWSEMCRIKNLFFKPEETVVQFHPALSEYVNFHPYTLHLWRNQTTPHELPPSELVGPKMVDVNAGQGEVG